MFVAIEKRKIYFVLVLAVTSVLFLILFRLGFPKREMDYVGPLAIIDNIFSLGLFLLILLISGGTGKKILLTFKTNGLTTLEQIVFGIATGLGVVAYGVLILAVVGMLYSWTIFIWLSALGLWTWREWSNSILKLPGWLTKKYMDWKKFENFLKVIILISLAIVILLLLLSLSPPNGYDGLMYHLQAPKLMLQAGRILLFPENMQANFPFTIEMLYTIGLAFNSDVLASLLHLTYAVLISLAILSFGKRFIGRKKSLIAVAILWGTWAFPFWTTMQNVDMAWALYEFLAFYCLILWAKSGDQRWLVFAGLMSGWAIGTKYLGLGGVAIFSLWILWRSHYRGLQRMVKDVVIYGSITLLIGSFWYIKNWIYLGNPVYPFLWGGAGWTHEDISLMMNTWQSYKLGSSIYDYLLMPINLYINNEQFSTSGVFDLPSLLFPIVIFYPLAKKTQVLNWLALFVFLRFWVWTLAPHNRYLVSLYPFLCLLTAHVLIDILYKIKSKFLQLSLLTTSVGSLLIVSLVIQIIVFNNYQPIKVITGLESKNEFLSRGTGVFKALQYIQKNLDPNDRVFMMWAGTGYYCDERCMPDTSQS